MRRKDNMQKKLFSLLSYALREDSKKEIIYLDRATWIKLFKLSKKHDVAHLIGCALKVSENKIDEDIQKAFEQEMNLAMFRYIKSSYDFDAISNSLENAQIKFIPLKGSVIRKYYPEPWMRSSCDIDILVHKEDLDAAISCLVKELQYTEGGRATHDASLFSPQNVHVELHFDLVEEGRAKNAIDVLRSVWENVTLHEGREYWYEMTDAYFYFYHIAHMAKHFETGGCGIRPFIDLWILDHIKDVDISARDTLLSLGGLLKFANAARDLSEVWFGDKEANETAIQMQDFLIRGGVYGSIDNRVALAHGKKGGRIRYILSRVFAPYSKLKRYYPILEKHKWLMPIMQVRRWFMLLKPRIAKMAKREMEMNVNIDKKSSEKMSELLEHIGLD